MESLSAHPIVWSQESTSTEKRDVWTKDRKPDAGKSGKSKRGKSWKA